LLRDKPSRNTVGLIAKGHAMSRRLIPSALLAIVAGAICWISARDVATQSGTPAYGVTDLGVERVPLAVSPGAFPSIQGYTLGPNGGFRAFSGNVAGGLHDLGTLGGLASQAHGSYFGSAVVGTAQVPSNAFHAFVQDGVFPNSPFGTLARSADR
jgi:hypothetical protein